MKDNISGIDSMSDEEFLKSFKKRFGFTSEVTAEEFLKKFSRSTSEMTDEEWEDEINIVMGGRIVFEKGYEATPLANEFLDRFGGKFGIHPTDYILFYQAGQYPNIGGAYKLPKNEIEFKCLLSQSIERGKNLLLTLPPSISLS